jgi:hypothetical protein
MNFPTQFYVCWAVGFVVGGALGFYIAMSSD